MAGRCDRDERGAFLVVWALALVALVTMAAIAIDLQSLRTDRRSDRLAADAAVVAGASSLDQFNSANGRLAACEKTWTYAAQNLGSPSDAAQAATVCAPFSPSTDPPGTSCTNVPGGLSIATPAVVTGSIGPYNITITTPVQNGDPLMTADAIGGGIAQGISTGTGPKDDATSDGTPCSRIGISISYVRQPYFGGVAGGGPHQTTVHSVARQIFGLVEVPANVVLLDPRDCHVLTQQGSGSLVIADNRTTTRPPGFPQFGAAVLISDASALTGSGACTSLSTNNDYVVEIQNNPGGLVIDYGDLYIKAYFPPTCGATHACNQNQISTGTTAQNIEIQDSSYSFMPPTPLPGPFTQPKNLPLNLDRTIVDYVFNCKADYSTGMSEPTPYNPPRDTTKVLQGPQNGCASNPADYVNEYVKGVLAGYLFPQAGATVQTDNGGGGPGKPCTTPYPTTGTWDFKCNFPNNFTLNLNGDAHFEQPNGSLTPGAAVVTGNAVVDSAVTLGTGNSLSIYGNARFGGTVSLSGSGQLTVTTAGGSPASPYPSSCKGTNFITSLQTCVYTPGTDFHSVFFDSTGGLSQTGGTLELDDTFAYAGYNASTQVGANVVLGGGGNVIWSPPASGSNSPFVEPNGGGGESRVALWSDVVGTGLVGASGPKTNVQSLTGGGTLSMAGVYFTPAACWDVGGNSPVGTAGDFDAQFIAYCMNMHGSSTFQLTPSIDTLTVPLSLGPTLIR